MSLFNPILKYWTKLLLSDMVARKRKCCWGYLNARHQKLKVPGASISNVLAGQLSGVVAMTRSGEPGKIVPRISTFVVYLPLRELPLR